MYADADFCVCASIFVVQAAEKLSTSKIIKLWSTVELYFAATFRKYNGLYAAHVSRNFGRFVHLSTIAHLLSFTRSGSYAAHYFAVVPADERSAIIASTLNMCLEMRQQA